ncbi:hypothetical protein [Vacuolonema iberomarrocanum]|uniref:hypothetical protein n=1 Tax=Vacuolonema iberomarrocanum TaxID=3454632 RepID=UPI0019E70AF6|nr:hypothetical protein [filamentous cyanobacterium LEGE 07170]
MNGAHSRLSEYGFPNCGDRALQSLLALTARKAWKTCRCGDARGWAIVHTAVSRPRPQNAHSPL